MICDAAREVDQVARVQGLCLARLLISWALESVGPGSEQLIVRFIVSRCSHQFNKIIPRLLCCLIVTAIESFIGAPGTYWVVGVNAIALVLDVRKRSWEVISKTPNLGRTGWWLRRQKIHDASLRFTL